MYSRMLELAIKVEEEFQSGLTYEEAYKKVIGYYKKELKNEIYSVRISTS